jgi:hypothetical protein
MGHLTWGDIVAILGSLASIFGGVRWLLSVYFKQQLKLEVARKDAYAAQSQLLLNEMESMRAEFKSVVGQLDSMIAQYQFQKVAAEKVYVALGQFVLEVKEKFKKYDQLQRPETYNEETKDANFGKVKVK